MVCCGQPPMGTGVREVTRLALMLTRDDQGRDEPYQGWCCPTEIPEIHQQTCPWSAAPGWLDPAEESLQWRQKWQGLKNGQRILTETFPKKMSRWPTSTWKVFSITDSREMQIKTTVRYHLTPVRMAIIKKTTDKCWQDVDKSEPLVYCWKEYKLGSVTLENNMVFIKKLKIDLQYDPAILLLGIHPKERKRDIEDISAVPCSWQHYSQ